MHFSSTSVLVQAPLATVWKALTEPSIVEQYFFGTQLDTTWQVGAPLTFRGQWSGQVYEDLGTVLSFEPPRELSYNYWSSFSGVPDSPGTRQIIVYKLVSESEATRVTVEQSNVDTAERAEHSRKNWSIVLRALKELLETPHSS